MVAPGGAFFDPLTENIDFLFGKWFMSERHPFFRVGVCDAADQFTFFRVARDDGGLTRFVGSQGILAEQQAESGFAPDAAVAGDTFFIQDGLYLGVEVDLRFWIKEPDGRQQYH